MDGEATDFDDTEEVVDVARELMVLADPWMTTEPQLYGSDAPENNL